MWRKIEESHSLNYNLLSLCSSCLAKRSEHAELVSLSYLLPGVAAVRLRLAVFQVYIPNGNKKEGQGWHRSCATAYLYSAVISNQTLCWVVYNGLDTKVVSQSLAARLMLDKRRRRRMDTHAALQSEQDFHLTRHINPRLLDIFSIMFRFSWHTTPPSHHWLVFEGKRGIKTHTAAGQKGQKATNIGLRIIYAISVNPSSHR